MHCQAASRVSVLALMTITLAVASGCGGDRIAVTGDITIDGKPMTKGVIKLVPAANVAGPEVATEIIEGRYAFDSTSGPVAGEHRVEIYLDQPLTPGLDDPEEFIKRGGPQGKVRVAPNTVHPKFNTRSTLKKTITTDGENNFDFAVTTVRKR